MTASQVARRLQLSSERVRQLAREGRLPAVQHTELGRLWDPKDVEAFASTRDQWGRYPRRAEPTEPGA
ncbi:MAG: helix-turn-helix domain-containing protein [Acidimicrobiales bacterium]